MDKKAYAAANQTCEYWRMARYINHGGCLPCGECKACVAERESIERLKRWNAATAAGADPRR